VDDVPAGDAPVEVVPVDDSLPIVAEAAARLAGGLLMDGRGRALRVGTKSSATDMVSEMDRASESAIRGLIARERPDDAILGEEGGEVPGTSGVRWVVDPLDGTTNYLYGFPAWAVSVAAQVDGATVAGAVYDPTHEELWAAVRGRGATRNGVALPPLDSGAEVATALVATGFAYRPERRADQGRVAAFLLPRVRDLRRGGSAALDLCFVAGGRVDAYFEAGTHIWDWAAGALIAAEAGAWVGGFDGGPPSEDGLLAARPGIATQLRALLAAGAG
jgi:myo-inositol-1(or 4)-monophosphatase